MDDLGIGDIVFIACFWIILALYIALVIVYGSIEWIRDKVMTR